MEYNIALIPGDGIGPEVVAEATKVLDKVCEKYGHTFHYTSLLMGGASIDVSGVFGSWYSSWNRTFGNIKKRGNRVNHS